MPQPGMNLSELIPTAVEVPPYEPTMDGLRLPTNFVPTGYEATLAIDPSQPTIRGTMQIEGDMKMPSAAVLLHARDLVIHKATANEGIPLAIKRLDADVVELRPKDFMFIGWWTLTLEYEAKITHEVRGAFRVDNGADSYVYSYFEPIHARRVFPCFDEPGIKVPWQLSIEVPKDQIAVSNETVVEQTPLDGGRTRFRFARTQPLPSYLVAFGVGPFEVVPAGNAKSGKPLRLVVPRGSGDRTAYAAKSLARIVDFFEGWFGIPLPYSKLDVIGVPSMGGGAMEHAGLITADASYVLLDPKTMSWAQRMDSVGTIGHEVSHQWFGDLVTPVWWDETWLKESFASWMEHKILGAFDPSWQGERWITTNRMRALGADSLATARQIRQPITKRDEIGETFDAITYSKGATVLGMLERFVGPEVFQRGVRDYLAAHMHGNATTADLISAIEGASGKQLAEAFSSYVDQPGVPLIEATLACDSRSQPKIRVVQQRFVRRGSASAGDPKQWVIPMCVAYDKDGKRAEACQFAPGTTEIALPAINCPRWVMPNAGGIAYYRVGVDEAAAQKLRDVAWPSLTWAERRALVEDVRAFVLEGRLPVALLASFVAKVASGEDRFTLDDVLDYRGLPRELGRLVGDDMVGASNAWVRATFGAAAKKRDFVGSPKDSLADEFNRGALVEAATDAGDPALVARAKKLAASYRDLPQATRALVLPVAARTDAAFAAKLRADAVVEADHDLRMLQLRSLAQAGLHLDLALDPKIPNEDVAWFIELARPSGQILVRWLAEHGKELLARFPADDTFAPFMLYGPFTCDPAQRDATVGVMTQLFGKMSGAAKILRQNVEDIDQCIAQRAIVEPSLRAWLKSTKSR